MTFFWSHGNGHFSTDVWKKSTPDWSGMTCWHALSSAACDRGAWSFCVFGLFELCLLLFSRSLTRRSCWSLALSAVFLAGGNEGFACLAPSRSVSKSFPRRFPGAAQRLLRC